MTAEHVPNFREYVAAPLTRDLRPAETEILRDALRREGMEPVPYEGEGPAPTRGENVVTFISLLAVIALISYVSFNLALWYAS